MNAAALEDLAGEWREEADLLRRRGAPRQADALESAAEDLERRLPEWRLEPLTVEEAARESGYSRSQLYALLSDGKLPNAGEPGAPRVRRCDLPRKPGHEAPDLEELEAAQQAEDRGDDPDGGSPVPRDADGNPDLAGAVLRRRGRT